MSLQLRIPTQHLIGKGNDISLCSVTANPSVAFKKLTSLKCGKAPEPDGWPADMSKQCADQLCAPLSLLFVKSLESGILFENWMHNAIYKEATRSKQIIIFYQFVSHPFIVIKKL